MTPPEKKDAGFQNLLNITAYLGMVLIIAGFLYHTLVYFGHIFEDSGGGGRNLGQDISISAVEIGFTVAITIVIVYLLPRGKEQEDDETEPTQKESAGN